MSYLSGSIDLYLGPMHKLRIQNKTYQIPQGWEELTRAQAKVCSRLAGAQNCIPAKAEAISLLVPKLRKKLKRLDGALLMAICDLVEWIWNRPGAEAMDDIYPILSTFYHKGRRWSLPKHSLLDVTSDEWKYADLFLQEMMDIESREEGLIGLIATICRPLRPFWKIRSRFFDGYPRQRFNEEILERRQKIFEDVDPWVRIVVQDYILRCSEMIRKRYSPVFEGEASGGADFGYTGLQLSVADAGVFGKMREVGETNIHDLLLYAMKKEMDSRAQRQKLESAL